MIPKGFEDAENLKFQNAKVLICYVLKQRCDSIGVDPYWGLAPSISIVISPNRSVALFSRMMSVTYHHNWFRTLNPKTIMSARCNN